MEKKEFIEKYGDVKVKFSSYYKYTFSFTGTLPNGDTIQVGVGGNADDIYKMEVGGDCEETIKSLDPVSGDVYHKDVKGPSYDSFYDY